MAKTELGGSTVEDWPFGYDELEPYYEKVNCSGYLRSSRKCEREN